MIKMIVSAPIRRAVLADVGFSLEEAARMLSEHYGAYQRHEVKPIPEELFLMGYPDDVEMLVVVVESEIDHA